jgi:hypothetical protein
VFVDNNEAAHSRRLLIAGAAGAAMSLLPLLSGRAGATAPPDSGPSDSMSPGDAGGSVPDSSPDSVAGAGENGSKSGSQGGGYSGTGDSTNASTDDTAGVTGNSGASGDTTGSSVADTTTTEAPRRPSTEDDTMFVFVQSAELAARDLYRGALAGGVFTDQATIEVINTIADSHEAYGQSISGLIGKEATNLASEALMKDRQTAFTGSAADVLKAGRALENDLAATHLEILGKLSGTDGAGLVASILVVEARNATVLAHLAGVDQLDQQLATEGKALSDSATK